MGRFAYIWIIAAVAFSLWFHSHEESERRSDITAATSRALYVGSLEGCKSNNKIILQVEHIADKLHPSEKAVVSAALKREPCRQRALRIVVLYNTLADH